MERRSVLQGMVAGTVGMVVGGLTVAPAAEAAAASGADFSTLIGSLSADASLFLPGDASYEALATPYNHRYAAVRPVGVLVPSTGADVQAAVRWGVQRGVRVVPRSSAGHNYAGYSTTPGLLVVMSRLRTITWNPANPANPAGPRTMYGPMTITQAAGTVTVGAGVSTGDLHPKLEAAGYFLPTGRCSSVGVAGLVLGGGIGFSDKMFGLTCDRLTATTIVLADGKLVTCSESSNPDLFWACRGGAGNNFGIHTDFTFTYGRFEGTVGFYHFRWSMDSAVAAMNALQNVAQERQSDRRFHARLGMGTFGNSVSEVAGNAQVTAIGQFYGTTDELKSLFAPVLKIGTAAEQQANLASIRQTTPAEATGLLNVEGAYEQFTSASAVLDAPLTSTQIQVIADRILAWPGSRSSEGVDIALFALGGAVNEKAPDATAFVHRRALFIAELGVNWGDNDPESSPDTHRMWLYNLYRAVFGQTASRAYQNFPDPYLANAQQAYYGTNYARLREVKRRYDPTEFFKYPQSIEPAR